MSGAADDAGDWLEVSIELPAGIADEAAGALLAAPFTGAAVEEGEAGGIVRLWLRARDDSASLRDALSARVAALAAALGRPEAAPIAPIALVAPSFRRVGAGELAKLTADRWRPFRVGHLCILPRRSRPPLRARDVALHLDPGHAFGTGHHPTTRMLLRMLQERPLAGRRLLDAGTGSGVLAVAAARLGARSVLGFDLDPDAVEFAERLAQDNDVAGACDFRLCDFDGLPESERGFDGVLANLYFDLLQERASDLAARLAPGGFFLFSGCREDEGERTCAALAQAGLRVDEVHRRGRWLAFAGAKPPGAARDGNGSVVPSEGLEPSTR